VRDLSPSANSVGTRLRISLFLCLLAACTSEDPFLPTHDGMTESVAATSLPAARLAGQREGCVILDVAETGEQIIARWPPGYTARADPVRLIDPSGNVIARSGDRIDLTGINRMIQPDPCVTREALGWDITRIDRVQPPPPK